MALKVLSKQCEKSLHDCVILPYYDKEDVHSVPCKRTCTGAEQTLDFLKQVLLALSISTIH